MQKLILAIRDRYHPLFRLRRYKIFRIITRLLDIPVGIRFPFVNHRIFVSLTKNLAHVISGGAAGEEKERKNFLKIVSLGKFNYMFDIGANIGIYGFMFREAVPDSRVVMFEPDRSNTKLIRFTIDRSCLSNITVVEAAVSNKDGHITFLRDDVSSATGSIEQGNQEVFVQKHHNYKPMKIRVKSITLDAFTSSSGDPDFIKIDVEGAELSVFSGAISLIKRARPAIFFECNSGDNEIMEILSEEGYVVMDFESLEIVASPGHNNIALHGCAHRAIIDSLVQTASGSLL